MSETRVCVKGLPKHLTDARLKEVFGEVGHVTDVKIVRTADGKSRLFGFVGFASSDETKKAVEHFNRTYIDTSLIQVELARGVNDPSLARPWSKYSEGSSRFVGKPGDEHNKAAPSAAASKRSRTETTAIDQLEKERDEKFAQFLKLAMPNKKLSEEKRTMPWENIEEEENEKKDRPAEEPQEELDDLAWLRAKQGLEPEQQEEKGGKKKKKKEEKVKMWQKKKTFFKRVFLFFKKRTMFLMMFPLRLLFVKQKRQRRLRRLEDCLFAIFQLMLMRPHCESIARNLESWWNAWCHYHPKQSSQR